MSIRRTLANIWQSLFRTSRLDCELDEELRAYLDDLIEKKVHAGEDPASARRAAMIEIGGMTQVKAEVRRARPGAGIDALWQDVRFSWRALIRKPAFAAVTIITFALGIGTNTAIFSIVNSILIQPLPYRNPSELVSVWIDMTSAGFPKAPLSGPELGDLRQRGTLFAAFGGIWPNSTTITGDREPEQLTIGRVTANFFDTLGASAFIGRTFDSNDEAQGARPTILLSHAVWQRRYGGDPSVVGRSVIVDGGPATIIGVMPADFRLLLPPDAGVPENLEAFVPFGARVVYGSRATRFLRVVGRMKPGVTLVQAEQEITQIGEAVSREFTTYSRASRLYSMAGLHSEGAKELRPRLLVLLAGVAILLLTACLNVASLLIARAASRTKETALRLAIGASYRQIVRQCLVEGLILSAIGAAVGIVFGEFSLRALVALRPEALGRLALVRIDTTVLIFTAGAALLSGMLFSFAPMVEVFRTDLIEGLLDTRRRLGTVRYRTRAALVVLQIAFGLMLLVGAGLLIRTFVSIQRLDTGYTTGQMLSFRVNVPGYGPVEQLNDFHRRLQTELAALPGVTGAGAVSHFPFDTIPNWGGPYYLKDGPDPTAPFADFRAVSPGYLETIGARLKEGRFFTEADDSSTQRVIIIDDLLAKRAFPGENPIGKRISLNPEFNRRTWMTVVGVVRHMRLRSFVEDLSDQIYLPIRQSTRPTSYVLRTTGDPAALSGPVREVIRRLDPQLPVYDMRPAEEYLVAARSAQRFTMLLGASFAAVSLVLAFVGVFGLITYSVNIRRHEFGVRLAIGARSREIIRLVLHEGLVLLAAGLLLGVAGASVLVGFLRNQLFGVTAFDIPTYAIAMAVIALAAFTASWFPARRASQSNPLDVLRTD
jgi:putative ABC transport system permease protein